MKDDKDFFLHWFVSFDIWYLKEAMNGEVTWFKIYGVRVHAWNPIFFEKLCLSRGKLLATNNITEKKKRLDVARCLVRTTLMKNIKKIIQVMCLINIHSKKSNNGKLGD